MISLWANIRLEALIQNVGDGFVFSALFGFHNHAPERGWYIDPGSALNSETDLVRAALDSQTFLIKRLAAAGSSIQNANHA